MQVSYSRNADALRRLKPSGPGRTVIASYDPRHIQNIRKNRPRTAHTRFWVSQDRDTDWADLAIAIYLAAQAAALVSPIPALDELLVFALGGPIALGATGYKFAKGAKLLSNNDASQALWASDRGVALSAAITENIIRAQYDLDSIDIESIPIADRDLFKGLKKAFKQVGNFVSKAAKTVGGLASSITKAAGPLGNMIPGFTAVQAVGAVNDITEMEASMKKMSKAQAKSAKVGHAIMNTPGASFTLDVYTWPENRKLKKVTIKDMKIVKGAGEITSTDGRKYPVVGLDYLGVREDGQALVGVKAHANEAAGGPPPTQAGAEENYLTHNMGMIQPVMPAASIVVDPGRVATAAVSAPELTSMTLAPEVALAQTRVQELRTTYGMNGFDALVTMMREEPLLYDYVKQFLTAVTQMANRDSVGQMQPLLFNKEKPCFACDNREVWRGRLREGEFFRTPSLVAKVGTVDNGRTYGIIEWTKLPVEITISGVHGEGRAMYSLAHELTHLMDRTMKLGYDDWTVHQVGRFYLETAFPAMKALEKRLQSV